MRTYNTTGFPGTPEFACFFKDQSQVTVCAFASAKLLTLIWGRWELAPPLLLCHTCTFTADLNILTKQRSKHITFYIDHLSNCQRSTHFCGIISWSQTRFILYLPLECKKLNSKWILYALRTINETSSHHSELRAGLWKEVQSEIANNTASQAWLVEETSLLPVHLSIRGWGCQTGWNETGMTSKETPCRT